MCECFAVYIRRIEKIFLKEIPFFFTRQNVLLLFEWTQVNAYSAQLGIKFVTSVRQSQTAASRKK
jgi:hypothetical protein